MIPTPLKLMRMIKLFWFFCYRSDIERAFSSLSVLSAIIVSSLINYLILTVLKITLISYTQVNQRLSDSSDGNPRKELEIQELGELLQKHWQTGNLTLLLNRAFGLHILCSSGSTFAKFTLVVYFVCISNIIFNLEKNPTPLYVALHSVSTLLMDFLLICDATHKVNSEVSPFEIVQYSVLYLILLHFKI